MITIVRTAQILLSTMALFAFAHSAMALPEVIDTMPASARIWENRSTAPDSDYQDFQGADVAYLDQDKGGWYFREANGQWRLFHEGDTLDLANTDSSITEALSYEVVSGTAFFDNGPATTYRFQLHGPTGELITGAGLQFNPHDFELLKGSKGRRAYYQVSTGQWWPASPELTEPLSRGLSAPYTPVYLRPNLIPATPSVDANSLRFDPATLRYFNGNGSVAAFHPYNGGTYRRWNNESGMPCAVYSDYPGNDVVYVAGVWYEMQGEGQFLPFYQGRYLSFEQTYGHDFLEPSLTANTPLGQGGALDAQGIKLDGESGQLVGENNQPIASNSYRSPSLNEPACQITYTLLLNDTLRLQGVAEAGPFNPSERSITLVQVVPLQFVSNNPFNDRSLPIAIRQAQAINSVTPVPVVPPVNDDPTPDPDPDPDPPPPPAPGNCPLNTDLALVSAIPASAPLAIDIGLTTGIPGQLKAGFDVTPIEQAMVITNPPLNFTQGQVAMASGFTYLSGSPLGTINEGSSLTYRIRRNGDSAEFELSFTFDSELVFDDQGIVITNLSGKLCVAGGPL